MARKVFSLIMVVVLSISMFKLVGCFEKSSKYTEEEHGAKITEAMEKLQKQIVRRWILDEGKRVDGRSITEIRPLSADVGILPRTHGSGMFKRGQTQVLTIATCNS